MRDRVRSVHLHDNNGDEDVHLFPGKGNIDWKKTMTLLRSCPNGCPLLLEVKESDEMTHHIDEAKRAAEYLNEIKTDEQ
jgi:sugar phosphate isomerase/epimerase